MLFLHTTFFLHHELVKRFVRPHRPIPKLRPRAVRPHVMRMMEVVALDAPLEGKHVERTPREAVSTVSIDGLQNSHRHPRGRWQDMHPEDRRPGHSGDQV